MASIRREVVNAIYRRIFILINDTDIDKQHESREQAILDDETLTNEEKSDAIRRLNEAYDDNKIRYNEGTKRVCENCQLECLATSFCEHCIRNYLKANFPNWTSGNDEINKLIQKCQMESIVPYGIIEWIPYTKLQNIEYFTKGGCSEIYKADWIGGHYREWDFNKQQLKRCGTLEVILKRLKNIESANRSWFEEVYDFKSNYNKLNIVNKIINYNKLF